MTTKDLQDLLQEALQEDEESLAELGKELVRRGYIEPVKETVVEVETVTEFLPTYIPVWEGDVEGTMISRHIEFYFNAGEYQAWGNGIDIELLFQLWRKNGTLPDRVNYTLSVLSGTSDEPTYVSQGSIFPHIDDLRHKHNDYLGNLSHHEWFLLDVYSTLPFHMKVFIKVTPEVITEVRVKDNEDLSNDW